MKPTSMLKKISVAGMLASCIFLVNCGKSKDETAAKIAEKMALENMVPNCSDETMEALRQRSTLFGSIREILAGALDDDKKQKVQTFINEISEKSEKIYSNVRSSKVAGFPATGCNFKEKEVNIKYELPTIKAENLALAKRVSKANDNKPNQILLLARPTWKAGDKLRISEELADLLSNETFINGKRVIHKGKVINGGPDFDWLKAKSDTSICISTVVDGQGVSDGDTPEISNIIPRLDDKLRITQDLALMLPSLSGKRSLLLTCTLADKSDLNDAMVDTFGSLLIKAEPAQ